MTKYIVMHVAGNWDITPKLSTSKLFDTPEAAVVFINSCFQNYLYGVITIDTTKFKPNLSNPNKPMTEDEVYNWLA